MSTAPGRARYNRRSYHGISVRRGLDSTHRDCYQEPTTPGRFGRMFPDLPARPDVAPFPEDLGIAGGPMDAGAEHSDNCKVEAGYTYLGQFIDHDITLDLTSSLDSQNDPSALRNFRTPSLELDNVYGLGPGGSPHQYDAADPGKLLLGPDPATGATFDLPRNSQGTAIIGDPRNDENMLVAQMHLGFLKFHNAVLDHVRSECGSATPDEQFAEAQRLVRWHYQWLVVHDYVPHVCGADIANRVFDPCYARRFYRSKPTYPSYMPVEFSVAAFRFGHSMVQPGYQVNDTPFGAPLFPETPNQPSEPRRDLRGGPIEAQHEINWKHFFDTGVSTSSNRQSSKIDAKLTSPLIRLPDSVVGADTPDERRSLAIRNLQRSQRLGLPSGQDVARRMGMRVLGDDEIWADAPTFTGCPAPLWYYILREAEVQCDGEALGLVGSLIVAEVFHGLLHADSSSYPRRDPTWTPTLGSNTGQFGIVDLLEFAGVNTQ